MDFPASPPALFQRLPAGIFSPLASPNRQHYWRLLTQLYQDRFGPDAPMPPSVGFQRREIVQDLERYLLTDDPWEADDGEAPDAPLALRASAIYERFRASGWLRQERIGARDMVSMPPVIEQLLGTLIDFAERGPTFLGAKVRAIELQLRQVLDGEAGGDTLDEAADQARKLLSFVAALGVQVRDVMGELARAESTAAFARMLFERYVSRLFLGDYAELHRSDHPLARRTAILAMVAELSHGQTRSTLLAWYRDNLTQGDAQRAELRLERSLRRLREIDRIDEYLSRLDDDIRQANRRALAYLDYRLRAPDKLDLLIQHACHAVCHAPDGALRLPVASGALMHEERLRPPRQPAQPIARTPNAMREATPEQLARMALLQRMKRARLVLVEDLARYVGAHLGTREKIACEDLPIETIADLRAFQTLLTLGMRSARDGQLRRDDPLRTLQHGFRVELLPGTRIANQHFALPRFIVHRTRKDAA